MLNNKLDIENKLLIDDFIAEIKEKFYCCRITYLKHLVYSSLKKLTHEKQDYLIEKIYADKFLLENFSDIMLEFNYLRLTACGMEDKLSKTKIVLDDAGKFKTLKLWDFIEDKK